MLIGSMLLVPTLALGVAQRDPANPPQQQLQPASEHEMVGVIGEVRNDSFSLQTEDHGLVWFEITPLLDGSATAELVTGKRIRVGAEPGESPDRMRANWVRPEAGEIASRQMPAKDTTVAEAAAPETDTDLDVDVDVDSDSASASIEKETELEDSNQEIAENETGSALKDDSAEYGTDENRDELPQTATSLPAVGALGLLALLGAAAIAVGRRF
jgi:hypothetical protein